jgi:hypothetical protein
MKSKKIMLFCLVTVLALSLMGFGFAKWSDTVNIGTTVATGNVDIKIDKGCVNDFGADPNKCPGDNRERKDVGSIKLTKVDDSNLKVEIKNAYPYYKPGFGFKITSEGTIPVKIDEISSPNWDGVLHDNIHVASWEWEQWKLVKKHGKYRYDRVKKVSSGYGDTDWNDLFESIGNRQLHKGDFLKVYVELYLDQQSDQNASTAGTISVTASQWNEVPGN